MDRDIDPGQYIEPGQDNETGHLGQGRRQDSGPGQDIEPGQDNETGRTFSRDRSYGVNCIINDSEV